MCHTVTYFTNFSDTAGGNSDSVSENTVYITYLMRPYGQPV